MAEQMFNPYQMMAAKAGMTDPVENEQMQKLMLANFLMGGGSSMLNAASSPRANFGQSISAGMMGGMNSMNRTFQGALQNQMYSNQVNRQDKLDQYRFERDKKTDAYRKNRDEKTDAFREDASLFDKSYRLAALDIARQKANPWADIMGGDGGSTDIPTDTKLEIDPILGAPSLNAGLSEQNKQSVAQKAAVNLQKNRVMAHSAVENALGSFGSGSATDKIIYSMTPAQAQEKMKIFSDNWEMLTPQMRKRVVEISQKLKAKMGP